MGEAISLLDKIDQPTLSMKRDNGACNFNLWVPTPPRDLLRGNRFQELQELEEEDVSDFQRRGVHLM